MSWYSSRSLQFHCEQSRQRDVCLHYAHRNLKELGNAIYIETAIGTIDEESEKCRSRSCSVKTCRKLITWNQNFRTEQKSANPDAAISPSRDLDLLHTLLCRAWQSGLCNYVGRAQAVAQTSGRSSLMETGLPIKRDAPRLQLMERAVITPSRWQHPK